MPDRDVKTVRDVIFFQYAKLVARSAFQVPDGQAAKKKCYGFIKNTFRALQSGEKNWSDILREDRQLVQAEKECAFCGTTDNLTWEHIVPRSIRINDRCPTCDTIQGIHNQIWSCSSCNSRKGTLGLYAYYRARLPGNPKYFDFLPALAEKKYLKTIYACAGCAGTLDSGAPDGGQATVIEVDEVVRCGLK